ncbi:MAG: hypothetical protein M5R42_03585 [Rhodocyclaceae bacterium]|nr:hypothetical protein [Rhodocyclaceae bacterium]
MPTAILTHGANPGLVSHLVKEALLNIARDTGHPAGMPQDRSGWAQLARDLNIRTIHIAERDTQVAEPRKAPGSSSTPGPWKASSAKAASPPNWAGAATRSISRLTAAAMNPAAGRRSGSTARAPPPGTHVDAAGRADPRFSHHAQRIDFAGRLPDPGRQRRSGLPAHRALCLPSLRRHRAIGA